MLKKENLKLCVGLIVIVIIIVIVSVSVILKQDKKSENEIKTNTTTSEMENILDLSTLDIEQKDEIGKEKIEEFLKIYKNNSPKGILVTLGLLNQNHTFNPEDYIDRFFAKTDIKYEDFKNKMLNYMTEELFEDYYNNQGFKEVDGLLCFSDIGGEEKEYEVTELKLSYNTENTMVYEISFKETGNENIEKAQITVVEKDNDYVVDKYEKI